MCVPFMSGDRLLEERSEACVEPFQRGPDLTVAVHQAISNDIEAIQNTDMCVTAVVGGSHYDVMAALGLFWHAGCVAVTSAGRVHLNICCLASF